MKIHALLFFLILAISCEKVSHQPKGEFETIHSSNLKFDLVFPQELWNEILKGAPPTVNIDKSAYDLFEALPIRVEIVDGSSDVLAGRNYRFEFKDFGGEIDYENYLENSKIGNFRIYFQFIDLPKDSEMRVFFLSWSKQYTRDSEVFGSGCEYFYDVTGYFKKEVFGNGLLLHTKNYRYLDVTAGRFYFVNYVKEKIQLAQVTFTDSSLASRLCENRF